MSQNNYLVIAKRWSDAAQKPVEYVAGEFGEYMNAEIFKKAYNRFYDANAKIIETLYATWLPHMEAYVLYRPGTPNAAVAFEPTLEARPGYRIVEKP